MNILVATDFTKPSEHAVELAAGLAKRLGDRLVVAFAHEPSTVTSPDFAVDVQALEAAVVQKAEAELKRIAVAWASKGVTVATRLVRGPVVDALVKLGHAEEARFIVAGTHARGAVGRLLLGSVAERLVLQADRPVLVARASGDEGLLAWAASDRALHVAVAVDQSAASKLGVEWIKQLRMVLPCDVTFLNFYWPPEQFARLGISTEAALDAADPVTVGVIEKELRAFVGELPGSGHVAFKIESNWGEIGSHLATAASDIDADLLIMGVHQRSGAKRMILGSTVAPTLHAAIVPVLAVSRVDVMPERAKVPVISQVLVATDLSTLSGGVVPYAYSLVERGGVVHLLHVADRNDKHSLWDFSLNKGKGVPLPVAAQIEASLQALVPEGADRRDIRTQVHIVEGGRVSTLILQHAGRLGVDAICVGSHGAGGLGKVLLGSVAQQVLEGATVPVFVVRGLRA